MRGFPVALCQFHHPAGGGGLTSPGTGGGRRRDPSLSHCPSSHAAHSASACYICATPEGAALSGFWCWR